MPHAIIIASAIFLLSILTAPFLATGQDMALEATQQLHLSAYTHTTPAQTSQSVLLNHDHRRWAF